MGASSWEYIVPYRRDVGAALDSLRHQVFEQGDYMSPASFGLPGPLRVEALTNEEYWEFMGTHGTHSILDVLYVVSPDDLSQAYATIRPLADEEYVIIFGSQMPSREDFAELGSANRLREFVDGGRGSGRVAVLWDGGKPSELAFWGYSGD